LFCASTVGSLKGEGAAYQEGGVVPVLGGFACLPLWSNPVEFPERLKFLLQASPRLVGEHFEAARSNIGSKRAP